MKLTNYLRNVFVGAVMADVPQTDYTAAQIELVEDDAVAQLPPAVRAVWDKKELRAFVNMETHYDPYVQVPAHEDNGFKLSESAVAGLASLEMFAIQQHEARVAMESKLRALAHSATTRAKLLELLPEELRKYVPGEDSAPQDRRVPAVIAADVVNELRNAGWKA